ncbi:MAG: hypothetical protein NC541_13540 [bacterium]|nr:hypothetical protein [bacterium]
MRIDSSTVGMESARSYKASNTTARRFSITDYQGGLTQGNYSLNAAIGGNAGNTAEAEQGQQTNGTEGAGVRSVRVITTMQDWQARFQASTSNVNIRSSASQSLFQLREQTIRYIFDMLFAARRNRLNQWTQVNGIDSTSSFSSSMSSVVTVSGPQAENSQTAGSGNELYYENGLLMMKPLTLAANLKALNYSQETYFEESESTNFSTVGTVKTADGREINFNVNVGMSREFQEYYKDDLELASFTMCDPLVINLDTDVAQLEDQTFYFDIDADGELDEVSKLRSGSGYLALDKNGDGVINDGSELFGTASGDGFADLARYDEDGNGWIDENDAIWDKLKIWTKDENGNDVLYRLADKGVGAICLQNAATDFTQKGSSGQTLGAVRSTGVFLYENGNVGTVQHVDVAKYSRGA